MDKKSYYAIIPASVRYDKSLKMGARLLYGEITALCNEKGFCWASNEYFASLYEVGKKVISLWINDLKNNGYIEVEIDKSGGNLRKIWISKKDTYPSKKGYLSLKTTTATIYNNTYNTSSAEAVSLTGKEGRETSSNHEVEEADLVIEEVDEDGNPIVRKKVKTRVPVDMALVDHKIAQDSSLGSKTRKVSTKKKTSLKSHYTPFDQKEELDKWKNGENKVFKILRLYFLRKGYEFENWEQWDSAISRNIRPATSLKGYSSVQVNEAMDKADEHSEKMGYEWTLETIGKSIINTANKR